MIKAYGIVNPIHDIPVIEYIGEFELPDDLREFAHQYYHKYFGIIIINLHTQGTYVYGR